MRKFLMIGISFVIFLAMFMTSCHNATSGTTGEVVKNAVKDIDGNSYNGIWMGNKLWMKENLRTTHYADGTSIPIGNTYSSTEPYYYAPAIESNISTYGYLYNWPAVMHGASFSRENPSGVQGICPDGWHVPSIEEWRDLEEIVETLGENICENCEDCIAKSLSAKTDWTKSTETCTPGYELSTNNSTGFTIFPAGMIWNKYYVEVGNSAYFWTTADMDYICFHYNCSYMDGQASDECVHDQGYSVRCVRD